VILTERESLWVWGRSLDRYSKPLKDTGGDFVRTDVGSKVFRYKYDLSTSVEEKRDIANHFAHRVIKVIKSEIYTFYPIPPFDVCVGVPPNRVVSDSLPRHICSELAGHYQWIQNGFKGIKKTRPGKVIKFQNPDDREKSVSGLFAVDKNIMPNPRKGFLVIDDVYATGATMKEICRTLKHEYPDIPIFMIVLTNLTITEKWQR
jgi:hypothetical protein